MIKNSENSPLRIAELPVGAGVLGLTFCPGKKDPDAMSPCERSLEADLQAIKNWGAGIVVTLLEDWELKYLQVTGREEGGPDFGDCVCALGMEWRHLPVKDLCPLDDAGEPLYWDLQCSLLRRFLHTGGRILVHCRGGLGRTGTLAARLLMEEGMDAENAIRAVREVRPGAIETPAQEAYLREGFFLINPLPAV